MELLTPIWSEYELIDSGGYEKLERFGKFILRRPEPQACWDQTLDNEEWESLPHVRFIREKTNTGGEDKGSWRFLKKMPEQWWINYSRGELQLKFRLGLTSFKHVGLFPEQATNWHFIFDELIKFHPGNARVLNLFAYTGGASLAAKAAGADVVHLDSVKPVVSWARENMEGNGLDGIHWVVEDAMKFVKREVRRGKLYNGIMLDPPAYGRGPDGEKWVLEEQINELLKLCASLLEPEKSFILINLYSMGFSSLVADNLLSSLYANPISRQSGELYIADRSGKKLPLGVFARIKL